MRIGIHVDTSGIDKAFSDVERALRKEAEQILMQIGENYVIEAKTNKTYEDQSGNLRGANSYAVYRDGVLVTQSIGRPETGTMFEKLKTNSGLQLIVGNGMKYASYVEGMGFNVCTSGFLKVMRDIETKFK